MDQLDMLVGESVIAIAHGPYRENIGVKHLDIVTSRGIYRFATEEIDGERTADGWTNDHYSLTLKHVPAGDPADERTDLAGTVVKADLVRCDEWLGPGDQRIDAYGANPRILFDGNVGSCPPRNVRDGFLRRRPSERRLAVAGPHAPVCATRGLHHRARIDRPVLEPVRRAEFR